jgi:tetratricopeptide (TPR) repeat protein
LFFNNMSKDPDLDWLRLGLADMLTTGLAQSPDVRVLTTDRLYQILEEMGRLDESITSFNIVREVAARGSAENVLIGSFMKAGDNIRISVRLQEVASGDVLSSEHVEGIGESSIFSMADQLTERIRAKLDVPQSAKSRPIEELTTSSPTAYRLWVEGVELMRKDKGTESLALFEKAVETDPEFAEAHMRLAVIHWNQSRDTQAERHTNLALANSERLPERTRYSLEARLSSFREEDYARAIQAYKKRGSLNNLSVRYALLERFDEAIEVLEQDRKKQGTNFPLNRYGNLIAYYIARGEYDRAHLVCREMLGNYPNNGQSYIHLGNMLLFLNELDEAEEVLVKADALNPVNPQANRSRWCLYLLKGDWEQAAAEADALKGSDDDGWNFQAQYDLAILALYKGHSRNALQFFDRASEVFDEPGLLSGRAHSMASHVLLEKQAFSESLHHAKLAQQDGKGNPPEWGGLVQEALSLARQGRLESAYKTAEKLLLRTESIPTRKEKRRHIHLIGDLALAQNQPMQAIEKLKEAESMLPAHGRSGFLNWIRIGPPPHVPIWYSLASAYLVAGDDDEAVRMFQRIIDCGVERVEWPIPYVRSFYFLGKIYENRGDMEKAREYYRRFVDYWGDGDIDRERVEEAKRKSV